MTAAAALAEQIQLIDLGSLEVHPANPRKDVGDISDIASSIKDVGQLAPLIAVRHNGKYQVVDGSRRLAALRKAGKASASVKVIEATEAEAASIAIISNLQRKELGPIEEAEAYRMWLNYNPGKTQKELAAKVGLDETTISNSLRLLDAPKPVKEAVAMGTITAAHARVAMQLKDSSRVSALHLDRGVTVDRLKSQVDGLNDQYMQKGAGAVQAMQKYLAEAKAAHPNATITWAVDRNDGYELGFVAGLGKPPAAIAGAVGPSTSSAAVTTEQHAKACACQVYAIRRGYSGKPNDFRLERVCSDKKLYARARPKSRKSAGPKPMSAAKQAAEDKRLRAATEKEVRAALTILDRPIISQDRQALYTRLRKGQIPADIARAIVYVRIAGSMSGEIYQGHEEARVLAWSRIAAMPAKKVSEFAAWIVADQLDEDLVHTPEEPDLSVLEYFGVESAKKARQLKESDEAERLDPFPGLIKPKAEKKSRATKKAKAPRAKKKIAKKPVTKKKAAAKKKAKR